MRTNAMGIAYYFMQEKGTMPCQDHCFLDTWANLKWSKCMVGTSPGLTPEKVRKRGQLHNPNVVG